MIGSKLELELVELTHNLSLLQQMTGCFYLSILLWKTAVWSKLALFKESALPNAEQRLLLICNWTLTPPHSYPDAKYWNSTFTIAVINREGVSDVVTLQIPRYETGWWVGVHFRTLHILWVQKKSSLNPTPLVLWVKIGRETCTRTIQSLSYN